MRKILFFSLFLILFPGYCFTQSTSGSSAIYEYRYLIDMPTAGVLEKGVASVSLEMLPYGTLISKIEASVFENFSFGISYGAENVIGSGKIIGYKLPGVDVRLRIIDESDASPAFTFGFNSQGKGLFDEELKRYEYKSPGFFGAVSKNFAFLGFFSLHGVINYSLERQDGDTDFNIMIGAEKTLGPQISLYAEYDFANNDNTGKSLGSGKGYLNLGLRWSMAEGMTIGFDLRNILKNSKINTYSADRALLVQFTSPVFK